MFIKGLLLLFWSVCVTTIFLLVWSVIGWYAFGVLGFFWLATFSLCWSVIMPLIFSILAWIFLL